MNTLELKGNILELLANIQDVNVLVKIKQFLIQSATADIDTGNEPEWLTGEQVSDLEKALEEIKDEKKWVPHDDHMQKFRTWSK